MKYIITTKQEYPP